MTEIILIPPKKKLDGHFIEASDKDVRRYNLLRYMYASQHIFSYNNDFSLIDFVYKLKGRHDFYKPNNSVSIVSGLGKY